MAFSLASPTRKKFFDLTLVHVSFAATVEFNLPPEEKVEIERRSIREKIGAERLIATPPVREKEKAADT
jgi:hypothetical protein